MTPSSAMEVRSRSAEVSAHTSSKGRLWGLGGGHRLGQQGNTPRLLSLPVCEMEIAAGPILWVTVKKKKLTSVKCLAQCLAQTEIQIS